MRQKWKLDRMTIGSMWLRVSVLVAALLAIGASAWLLLDNDGAAVTESSPAASKTSLPWPAFALAHAQENAEVASLADVAERAINSVVSVASTKTVRTRGELPFQQDPLFRHFFGPHQEIPEERRESGLGSGVIVDADGTVLTNSHVVDKASEITVILPDQREFQAKVVGTDPKTDLAVLRLQGDFGKLTALEMGDSRQLRLGDVVLAIGNPFGLGQTVTMGIVSATSRTGMGIVDYEDFIQTDAAINPGNSGGAMVNMEGRLVGINTAILSRTGGYQGIGFATPTSMVRPILKSIVEHGKVVRGWLGVSIQSIDQQLQEALGLDDTTGVLISGVEPGGPAEKAGIQRGDVVVSFAGTPVETLSQFRNRVAATPPGSTQKLTIQRNGKSRTLQVRIGTLPANEAPEPPAAQQQPEESESLGMELLPLSDAARSQLNVPKDVKHGVVVGGVSPGSPAATGGLRAGDIIVEANRQPVTGPAQFQQQVQQTQGLLLLLVLRGGSTFYATLRRPE